MATVLRDTPFAIATYYSALSVHVLTILHCICISSFLQDTHFEIAKYAIEKGIHVLVTKPPVMTVKDQLELVALAKAKNVFVMVEYVRE